MNRRRKIAFASMVLLGTLNLQLDLVAVGQAFQSTLASISSVHFIVVRSKPQRHFARGQRTGKREEQQNESHCKAIAKQKPRKPRKPSD